MHLLLIVLNSPSLVHLANPVHTFLSPLVAALTAKIVEIKLVWLQGVNLYGLNWN